MQRLTFAICCRLPYVLALAGEMAHAAQDVDDARVLDVKESIALLTKAATVCEDNVKRLKTWKGTFRLKELGAPPRQQRKPGQRNDELPLKTRLGEITFTVSVERDGLVTSCCYDGDDRNLAADGKQTSATTPGFCMKNLILAGRFVSLTTLSSEANFGALLGDPKSEKWNRGRSKIFDIAPMSEAVSRMDFGDVVDPRRLLGRAGEQFFQKCRRTADVLGKTENLASPIVRATNGDLYIENSTLLKYDGKNFEECMSYAASPTNEYLPHQFRHFFRDLENGDENPEEEITWTFRVEQGVTLPVTYVVQKYLPTTKKLIWARELRLTDSTVNVPIPESELSVTALGAQDGDRVRDKLSNEVKLVHGQSLISAAEYDRIIDSVISGRHVARTLLVIVNTLAVIAVIWWLAVRRNSIRASRSNPQG